jgi:hypothetical protein
MIAVATTSTRIEGYCVTRRQHISTENSWASMCDRHSDTVASTKWCAKRWRLGWASSRRAA